MNSEEQITEEVTIDQINKYKTAYYKQKQSCKKYHMSGKGKEKRREAQKRYYDKKRAEKLAEAKTDE